MRYVKIWGIVAISALSFSAQAADKDFPMAVNSVSSGDSVTSAPASGMVTRSGKSSTVIKINNSCFATNLRGVGNPLAASAIVNASLVVSIGGKDYPISVKYPALVVRPEGMAMAGKIQEIDSSNVSIPNGGKAAIFGNSVILNTPIPTGVTVDAAGNVTIPANGDIYLKSYSFSQTVQNCNGGAVYGGYGYSSYIPTYPCGDYMGKSGAVSASFGGISVSSDKSNVEINVAFPGETGFCGGYWSPLMVFFDDGRPEFKNTSDFPLNPFGKTHWPDAGSPGWFVALDRDKSGMIDKKDELFGDNASAENGFEVLKKMDTNKDGVIDHRDKDFKKLVIWNDKNGDGISQKEEVEKLHKRIVKVSLKYQENIVTPLGPHAEARETADFWFKEKGKVKKGKIVDIWLAPVETRLSQK
nr:hypothetical protein BdHM001_19250 [Bdellovibrio sp. HM001]